MGEPGRFGKGNPLADLIGSRGDPAWAGEGGGSADRRTRKLTVLFAILTPTLHTREYKLAEKNSMLETPDTNAFVN